MSCSTCIFFRSAYQKKDRMYLDDAGWCVRYPPVFVGGRKAAEIEDNLDRYEQPVVVGGDECGEHKPYPKRMTSQLKLRLGVK